MEPDTWPIPTHCSTREPWCLHRKSYTASSSDNEARWSTYPTPSNGPPQEIYKALLRGSLTIGFYKAGHETQRAPAWFTCHVSPALVKDCWPPSSPQKFPGGKHWEKPLKFSMMSGGYWCRNHCLPLCPYLARFIKERNFVGDMPRTSRKHHQHKHHQWPTISWIVRSPPIV